MKKHLYILICYLCSSLNLNAQEEFEVVFPIYHREIVQENKLIIDTLGSEFGEKIIHSSDTSFVILSSLTNSTDGLPKQHINFRGIIIRELNYEGDILFEKLLFINLSEIGYYSNIITNRSNKLLIPYNKNITTYCGIGVKPDGNKRGLMIIDNIGNKLNDIEFSSPKDCKDEYLCASFIEGEEYIQFYKFERENLIFEKRDQNYEALLNKSINLPYHNSTTNILKIDSSFLHVHLEGEALSRTHIDKKGDFISKKTNKLNLKNKSSIKHCGYIYSKENEYYFISYNEGRKITSNIYKFNSEGTIIDSVSLNNYELIDLCFYKGNLLALTNKTHSNCSNKVGVTLFDKKLCKLHDNYYDSEYLKAKSIHPTKDDSFIILGSKVKPYQCFKKNEKSPSQTFIMKKQIKL